MPNDVQVEVLGQTLSHRRPGPFKVEVFKSGFAAVTNDHGINWLSGCGDATLFDPADAQVVADALNEATA